MNDMLEELSGKLFIDGDFVAGRGSSISVENPATQTVLGTVPLATSSEIDAAVNAARRAFPMWSRAAAKSRSAALHRLGDAIKAGADEMASLMTMEQGKPVNEARGEILKLSEACHFYAEEAVRVFGSIIPNDTTDTESYVVREPIGVVGAITPWNYPAELIGWKLCGALAAGCTIVVKPAELTPFTALAIAAKVKEAGIPDGVVNVVTGSGSTVGQALVEHPGIDKIAFTGSSRVGMHIQNTCPRIKRLSLELGGNCPMIVTARADVAAAVKGAARRAFRNNGQICIAINRIYVQRPVYDDFVAGLAKSADALVVANGLEQPDADVGAMASAEPLNKTIVHLRDALKKGAKLVAGGDRPQGDEFSKGYFFRPTVVVDCDHTMQVMTQETFGPLVGVMPFDRLVDAVELCNDTPYGLASYLYTRDATEIRYVPRRLDYGNVAVNNVDAGIMNAPYGGRKQSGFGYEHGREGMLEYFNFKHIRVHLDQPEDSEP
jgi:succinate-semialdehyde dehydrogenase/glutarate-semialdehyde dehydrogenase